MEIDLSAFHFLRPLWLLAVLLGVLLPLLWHRSQDVVRRLQGSIAPHLLPHLLLTPRDNPRLRPVHLISALLVLGGLATAGPTWEQDRPPFLENKAPLILALDLSPSMNADDTSPTRLEAARHKLHDLIARRTGARTGLLVYGGSAHLVLPPTEDAALLNSFLQALSSELIERPGKDVVGVIDQARRLLDAEGGPGSLVLLTDGADTSQLDEIGKHLAGSKLQMLVLAVGSADAGIIRMADGQPRTDASGRPVLGSFDKAALEKLAEAADAPLGSLTLNNDDLDWIELHAQRHFVAASDEQRESQWKDAGYWLTWPLLVLAFLCVRRGWSLNWSAALLLALNLTVPQPSRAEGVADAFLTPDQQGRWAFKQGHYPTAAAHFKDSYWKGIAAYRAADYDLALASFARLDSAPAYFYQGNIHTRRFHFDEAITAYRRALELQPQFPEASANLALAIALQKDHDAAAEKAPNLKPDEVKFDQSGSSQGETVQTPQASSDALWLQNLSTSPAKFLKQKFSLQDAANQARGAVRP